MPLSVRLSGYNVDADLLGDNIELLRRLDARSTDTSPANESSREFLSSLGERARALCPVEAFTPETVSAAYARISRDPKHVTELRRLARLGVARARKSNETIIFGLGHASIAEHAVFNFDVSGISRLASEELQAHRLLSFTEKSQRYIRLGSDYVVPPEICGSAAEADFRNEISVAFAAYEKMLLSLYAFHLSTAVGPETDLGIRDLENRAKEDARYLLPLATETQMGMTTNARNVEYVVRDFSDHPLAEVRDLGLALAAAVEGLAPSLVKYTSRGLYPRANRGRLRSLLSSSSTQERTGVLYGPSVRLVSSTPDAEAAVLGALAFASGAEGVLPNRREVWVSLLRDMRPHDGAPREFELACMTFEAAVSASCFAQLKRHRMMTLVAKPYVTEDDVMVPPSIVDAGMSSVFIAATQKSKGNATRIRSRSPLLYPYLLTNSHVRRVMFQINARELYHFVRLRSDGHAQWEIRSLADQMLELAKSQWPNIMLLACGKDKFASLYDAVISTESL